MSDLPNNVINLFSRKAKADTTSPFDAAFPPTPAESTAILDLEQLAERNKANEARLAKERAAANKSVLRSYRLKT